MGFYYFQLLSNLSSIKYDDEESFFVLFDSSGGFLDELIWEREREMKREEKQTRELIVLVIGQNNCLNKWEFFDQGKMFVFNSTFRQYWF